MYGDSENNVSFGMSPFRASSENLLTCYRDPDIACGPKRGTRRRMIFLKVGQVELLSLRTRLSQVFVNAETESSVLKSYAKRGIAALAFILNNAHEVRDTECMP